MVMGFLPKRRRCSCGCDLSPRHLDVFRGLRLVMLLCLELIWILVGKAGRCFRDAILPSWNPCNWQDPGSDHGPGLMGLPVIIESWECDLCERVGEGDGNSYFALEEIDHFLESRCRGSLRRHAVADDRPMESATGRTVVVGLGSTWVEAGQTLFINAGTRESFQAMRLFVPSAVAEHFMIEGLIIGKRQLLASRIPAMFFTESCAEIKFLEGKNESPALITVSVTNMARKGKWFQGAVMGLAVEEPGQLHNICSDPRIKEYLSGKSGLQDGFDDLSGGARIAARELAGLLEGTES